MHDAAGANATGLLLLGIGGLLLVGLATDALGRRAPLPRVTLLLLFGVAIGESGFGLVPAVLVGSFDLVADMALLMIGFLLGERLTRARLRGGGRRIAALVLGESLGAALLVLVTLALLGVALELALPLAGIAAASAPAATLDVVEEEGADGPFTETLLEIVALDDVLGLLLFSLGLAVALVLNGHATEVSPLATALRDIGGALLVGIAIGVPGAYLSGRVESGQPLLVEALGLVFLCGGLARLFDVSFLIAAMAMGATIANLARHHERPFHAIEGIEWPFMILFFTLAGATLDLRAVAGMSALGGAYVLARALGRVGGCWVGAVVGGAGQVVRRHMGLALLPQAGVAVGMALVAAARLPEHRQSILSLVITTTILFELLGPVFTRRALRKAGESRRAG